MKNLLFEGSIDICGQNVGIRIYKEGDRYVFEPSHYLQNEDKMDVHRLGSTSMALNLEELLYKIEKFKKDYTNIINSEPNPNY